ncbi:hypothetical protein Q9R30_19200 [Arthrobacter sp. AB6]|uniref:hypothetical protein n=1 Tax=Arthrobacter sp. AB6 TaxID=2962570 RepID=UPI00288284CE|nr:hypothetical protein [Arthrobacter sp. AB6]MDT0197474.1 hypothetical protein [Arthrobacter sp. AB6]
MTNVEEARFPHPSHPYTRTVHLPKPHGSTRDEHVLLAEAEEEVRKELPADEYVQQHVNTSSKSMGDRDIWDISFQIDLKKNRP